MKRLCRLLDIPLYQGIGILEALWHLTAREAYRGDVGKLTDDDIALGIDWRGEASILIDALSKSGWLDSHPEHRLLIHDWPEHADDSVQLKLARARQFFADGSIPKTTKLGGDERKTTQQWYSVRTECAQEGTPCARSAQIPHEKALPGSKPLPGSIPGAGAGKRTHPDGVSPENISNTATEALIPRQQNPKVAQMPSKPSIADRGKAFLAKYPKQEDLDKAFQVYISIARTDADCEEIDQGLDVHLASVKWTDEFGNAVPEKAKSPYWFLFDGNYKDRPKARGQPQSGGLSGLKYWKKSEEQLERERIIAREAAEDLAAAAKGEQYT